MHISTQSENQLAMSLLRLYKSSEECCIIAGQAQEINQKAKLQQFNIINEEVQELKEAIEDNNLTEQLDACIDTLVTVFGFMVKLERQGANLSKAMDTTGDNNLSKFPTDRSIAEDTVEFYLTKNKPTTISYNPVYSKYVIRDNEGKYKKPKGFVENDLSSCFNY